MDKDSKLKTRLTLLEKIKDQHNDVAWSDFVYYYRNYIFSIVKRMNLSDDDSQEVVQMVLIKLWNELPDFTYSPGKGRFRGWLCSVTGNTVKNYLRDVKSRFVTLDPDQEIPDAHPGIKTFNLPEIETIAEEEWAEYLPKLAWKNIKGQFNEIMDKLFTMMHEGKSNQEIAKALDTSVDNIYVYKQRIREKLRPEMDKLTEELG